MLSNPSQVLVRNHTLFEEGRWLLINAPDSAIFRELSSYDIRGFHQFYPVYDAIPSAEQRATRLFLTSTQTQHSMAL